MDFVIIFQSKPKHYYSLWIPAIERRCKVTCVFRAALQAAVWRSRVRWAVGPYARWRRHSAQVTTTRSFRSPVPQLPYSLINIPVPINRFNMSSTIESSFVYYWTTSTMMSFVFVNLCVVLRFITLLWWICTLRRQYGELVQWLAARTLVAENLQAEERYSGLV